MRRILPMTACGVLLAGMAIAKNIPEAHDMPPTEVLEKEHKVIERVAKKTRQIAENMRKKDEVDVEQVRRIHGFFVNFADRCHHGKEEDELFPALRKRDVDPVILDLLIKQHEEGRLLLQGVASELDKHEAGNEAADTRALSRYLHEYGTLMPRHIDTENNYLWPRVRETLSQADKQDMKQAFYRIETNLAENFHQKYHAIAMDILGKND